MHSMKDRKIRASKGSPKSEAFFPEGPHVSVYNMGGEVNHGSYPDTAPEVNSNQMKNISSINKGKASPGYRH